MNISYLFRSVRLVAAGMLVSVMSVSCESPAALDVGFQNPPESVKTGAYWYWIDGNITEQGVLQDLEAMKVAGIDRVFIGNVGGQGIGDPEAHGVKLFSEEWWNILHSALKRAGELGIEVGMFNSPGWSQSGGPWVRPEESMRYLAASDTVLEGPGKVRIRLRQPVTSYFEDVRVLAYPQPLEQTLTRKNATVKTTPIVTEASRLIDSDTQTGITFPGPGGFMVEFRPNEAFTARSLTIWPTSFPFYSPVDVQAWTDGEFRTIHSFAMNRSNPALSVGYEPYAPVVVSFDSVTAPAFRLVFHQTDPRAGIAEIRFSSLPKVESYKEKILAKMYQGLAPTWDAYMWRDQPECHDSSLYVSKGAVIDLSDRMTEEGYLEWDVPAGRWTVLRTGMASTGVTNAPAMPDATGLEVDKLSRRHISTHFDAFIGRILERIPAEDRKTFKVVVMDSYETGGQNFTDDFLQLFEERYGYDPTPYLPVYFGAVVGDERESDRFLWDVRRLVADKIAYDYVGGLRDVCHQHGLTTWLENYGHWGFPAEFLQYGGQSDEVGGEFWCVGPLGDIENRAASSCAHIYGKPLVSCETSTSDGPAFMRTPADLKQRMDRFFTEGVNNTVFHVYISQPDDHPAPGLNSWFATEFNRNNTWFSQMDQYTRYVKRCNYMMRQGIYQTDIAYFIGDDCPKMTGVRDPEVPLGCQFDYINSEVILRDLTVSDGRLVLPHGHSYRMLVLPRIETMRPEVLDKLEELVAAGATVVGPAPLRSPSLAGQPEADQHIARLAREMWGDVDGKTVFSRSYGKGKIYDGVELDQVLADMDCPVDCEVVGMSGMTPIWHAHNKTEDADIYLLSNQSDGVVEADVAFRLTGKRPELWLPTTGEIRDLPAFETGEKTTVVPLRFERNESYFVVFRRSGAPTGTSVQDNFPTPEPVCRLDGTWQVAFESQVRQPRPIELDSLIDLSTHTNDSVRYFAGEATYATTVDLPAFDEGETIFLNLGRLTAMAKVKINGTEAGGVWTWPYRLDISPYVQAGSNRVEI